MTIKASPVVHTLPYPALEGGNLSFPEGLYEAKATMDKGDRFVEIEHIISGAPFIENLIEQGLVQFSCLLSIPKAGVRRLIETEQKGRVELDKSLNGEPPKLRPVLLYVGEDKEHEFTEKCGVAKIWQGKKITLPRGAKLARGDFFNITPSDYHFIRVRPSEKRDPGTFSVKPNTEDGFYFTVDAAIDVEKLIRNPGKNRALRYSVLTGVVGRCFSILGDEYSSEENSIEAFPNLRVLSDKLKAEFDCDWTDRDNFDPMLAATIMRPIEVPKALPDEDEE